jgi:hypothetical protein
MDAAGRSYGVAACDLGTANEPAITTSARTARTMAGAPPSQLWSVSWQISSRRPAAAASEILLAIPAGRALGPTHLPPRDSAPRWVDQSHLPPRAAWFPHWQQAQGKQGRSNRSGASPRHGAPSNEGCRGTSTCPTAVLRSPEPAVHREIRREWSRQCRCSE